MINVQRRGVDRHNWDKVHIVGAYYLACSVVDSRIGAEVRNVLEDRLPWRSDHQLPLRSIQVGMVIAAILGRPGQHMAVLDVLKELPDDLQAKLEVIRQGRKAITYRKIESTVTQLARILSQPEVLVEHDHLVADPETGEKMPCPPACQFMVADATWYVTGMGLAAIPDDVAKATDMALDWTDDPTWAKERFARGCDAESAPGDELDYHGEAICAQKTSTKGQIGDDGRAVPSKDSEARKGHRSPRSNLSEFFIGFYLHTMVGVPGSNGKRVAPFTFGAQIVPAGAYAGDSAIAVLRTMRHFGLQVDTLIADRGYTALDVDRFSRPVRELVGNIVLDLVEHQRKRKPDHVVVKRGGKWPGREIRVKVIAGSYFASSLSDDFDALARPGRDADAETVAESLAEFDFRAQFAFVRHGSTNAGTSRWAGPATKYAGYKIVCPNYPPRFKGHPGDPEDRPITNCVKGQPCSCGAYITVADRTTEREQQDETWGTTAWTKLWNRRTAVERQYADDKIHVGSLARGNIRCFGKVKHAIYYAPMAAARNLQVALRWYHQEGIPDPWDLHRLNRDGHRPDVAPKENPAPPTPAAPAAAAQRTTEASTMTAPAAVDLLEEPQVLATRLNRQQRRAAERKANSGRRGTSKPPKPPPKGTAADEL